MNGFHCDACGGLVFFESVTCVQCGHAPGFLPDRMDMSALEPDGHAGWRRFGAEPGADQYRSCANGLEHAVCNWLVPAADPAERCVACRMNEMIPDLGVPENLERWHRVEIAKRRLVYTLRRLGLPTDGDAPGGRPALRLRFLVDLPGAPHVVTGHENGVVTLNLAEADDAERERLRVQFVEPQRTLVGHLRHEAGHYLHVVDALETAAAFGLSVRPRLPAAEPLSAEAVKAVPPPVRRSTP